MSKLTRSQDCCLHCLCLSLYTDCDWVANGWLTILVAGLCHLYLSSKDDRQFQQRQSPVLAEDDSALQCRLTGKLGEPTETLARVARVRAAAWACRGGRIQTAVKNSQIPGCSSEDTEWEAESWQRMAIGKRTSLWPVTCPPAAPTWQWAFWLSGEVITRKTWPSASPLQGPLDRCC